MPEQQHTYPAPIADVLRAQDEGAASLTDPDATCPYGDSTEKESFLRQMWCRGRAAAKVALLHPNE